MQKAHCGGWFYRLFRTESDLTNWEEQRYALAREGAKLMETGTDHWINLNFEATNEFNFTALPSGYRRPDSSFDGLGNHVIYWTSTAHTDLYKWTRDLHRDGPGIYRYYSPNNQGFSVRCVKD